MNIFVILLSPLILVAAAAPVGATVCGAVAISRIRRSGGKLYGLGLALADTLLFPLLLLDGLIIAACYGLAFTHGPVVTTPGGGTLQAAQFNSWIMALGVVICGVLDFVIVRRAWRAAKRPVGQTPDQPEPKSEHSGQAVKVPGVVALFIRLVYTLAVLVAMWPFFAAGIDPDEPKLWTMFLICLPAAIGIALAGGFISLLAQFIVKRINDGKPPMGRPIVPLGPVAVTVIVAILLGMAYMAGLAADRWSRHDRQLPSSTEATLSRSQSAKPAWREAVIPDCDTKGVPVILDLASGEMLAIPRASVRQLENGMEEVTASPGIRYFTHLGKGDIGFDRVIFILRGGTLATLDGKFVEPKEVKEDASAYDLNALPAEVLVKTGSGATFKLRTVSMTPDGGLRIRYAPPDAAPMPQAEGSEVPPTGNRWPTTQSSDARSREHAEIVAVVGQFLTAVRNGESDTMKQFALGSVDGWQEQWASDPQAPPVGKSALLLGKAAERIRQLYAADTSLLTRGYEVSSSGDSATVKLREPGDTPRRLIITLARTRQGWRVLNVDEKTQTSGQPAAPVLMPATAPINGNPADSATRILSVIVREKDYDIGGRQFSRADETAAALMGIAKNWATPMGQITIRVAAEPQAQWSRVVDLYNSLVGAGFRNVAFASVDSGAATRPAASGLDVPPAMTVRAEQDGPIVVEGLVDGLAVHLDRQRLAQYGLTVGDVIEALRSEFKGDAPALTRLTIKTSSGLAVPLGNIAAIVAAPEHPASRAATQPAP